MTLVSLLGQSTLDGRDFSAWDLESPSRIRTARGACQFGIPASWVMVDRKLLYGKWGNPFILSQYHCQCPRCPRLYCSCFAVHCLWFISCYDWDAKPDGGCRLVPPLGFSETTDGTFPFTSHGGDTTSGTNRMVSLRFVSSDMVHRHWTMVSFRRDYLILVGEYTYRWYASFLPSW